MIRRSLRALFDPYPSKTDKEKLWQYFNSSCAYCGALLERSSRLAHADHLAASSLGGSNSIYNHVLSCHICNGDEKREEHWLSFLARKVTDPALAAQRRRHIEGWLARGETNNTLTSENLVEATSIIEQTIECYNRAVVKLRSLR